MCAYTIIKYKTQCLNRYVHGRAVFDLYACNRDDQIIRTVIRFMLQAVIPLGERWDVTRAHALNKYTISRLLELSLSLPPSLSHSLFSYSSWWIHILNTTGYKLVLIGTIETLLAWGLRPKSLAHSAMSKKKKMWSQFLWCGEWSSVPLLLFPYKFPDERIRKNYVVKTDLFTAGCRHHHHIKKPAVWQLSNPISSAT